MAITGSVVVITGAGGMGMACARRLGSGRRVILADYSDKALDASKALLQGEGFSVESYKLDVSNYSSVTRLAEHAAAIGHLEAIIHTAGVSPGTGNTKQIYEIDLLGTANVIEAFLPVVSVGSSVVCIASSSGHGYEYPKDLEQHLATAPREKILDHEQISNDDNDLSAYRLSKRANILRVQIASLAYGKKAARINSISPGTTSTPMGQEQITGTFSKLIRAMVSRAAFDRFGTPHEIAAAAAFLCGPDASFVTGTDLLVDGGLTAGKRWASEGQNWLLNDFS